MNLIRLDDIIIEPLSSPHDDIPDDSKFRAQLIIDQSIFVETLAAEAKEASCSFWELKVNCEIPGYVCSFSIGIVRESASEGTRLLGLVETRREEILSSIERKESLSLQLSDVNHDGPSLKLMAKFTTIESPPHHVFGQITPVRNPRSDTPTIEFTSLKSEAIWPRLKEMYETAQNDGAIADLLELSVMYERILLLATTDERKPKWLNLLGDIYKNLYNTSKEREVGPLNQAVSAYQDSTRHCVYNGIVSMMYWRDLGNSLRYRFERLGHVRDIERSIAVLEEVVRSIPLNGHPDKSLLLNNLGTSLLRRFERLGDLVDISQSILMFENAIQLPPGSHADEHSRLNNLGGLFFNRFKRLGDLDDINKSILMFENALRLTPDGHPNKPSTLNNFATSLLSRFERFDDIDDINKAILMSEDAIRLTPDGHPNKPSRLNNLGGSLFRRFEWLGDLHDINKSALMFEDSVQLTPDDHPNKPARLNNLGNSLFRRFEWLGDLHDINKSILMKEDAIRLTPDGHPDKPSWLNDLGSSLLSRFKKLGDIHDINQSILMKEDAVQLTPDDHPDKPSRLNNLGNSLLSRFERLGDLNDINKAVLMFEDAIRLTPDGHPQMPSWMNNLGSSLFRRFGQFGVIDDINKSIQVLQDSIQLTPDGHPDKPLRLSNLGSSLVSRFEQLGDVNDINKSILIKEDAVQLTSDNYLAKASIPGNLGISLSHCFEQLGDLLDIKKAVLMFEDAVRLTPDGHPDKPSRLNNLGNSLLCCFEQLGDINIINQAVLMFEDAIHLTPEGHPDKPSWMNSLGSSLFRRFEQLGDLHDINKSIKMSEDAIQLTPDDHPNKHYWLNSLGNSLLTRFEQLGDLHDVNRSILILEDVIQLTSDGHPNKPSRLNNLGNSLLRRFERLGDLHDINQSILMFENAVQLTLEGHSNKSVWLNNLGNSLLSRFERFDDLDDMNKSILVFQDAVQMTPDNHPDKPSRLSNLGDSLFRRFEGLGDLHDIDKSILMTENAIKLTPDGHPNRSTRLNNLGIALFHRFQKLGNIEDQILSITCHSSAALAVTGHPLVKFRSSSQWAYLAEQFEDSSSYDAYSTALAILPQLAWLGSPVKDRHFHIKEAGAVVRRAAVAAIDNDTLTTAIEWLEQGHSVIWGQLLNLRLPLDDLKSLYPELGQQLLSLSLKLEGAHTSQASASKSSPSRSPEALDYHSMAHERDLLISQIQQMSGFERFLLPKPLSELMRACKIGPIVMLNASERHCDVLILVTGLCNDVLHIPLPNISCVEVETLHTILQRLLKHDIPLNIDMLLNSSKRRGIKVMFPKSHSPHQVFQDLLFTIWEKIVQPIVQGLALTVTNSDHPCRIWWCPTGPFSFLPLHAAGNYSPDAAVGSKMMDYAISSYTPSLTSLIQALDSTLDIPKVPQLLVVTQSSTTGHAHLPGTVQELKLITDQAAKYNIKISSLEGSDATVSQVKEGMRNASWVHFACHGVQNNKDPTESALLLSGSSRLTLSEIIGMKLSSKDLAFLSACQTATGDESLSDEAVHLAAGMLSAGYRGVLATMWSISDSHAPAVANDVYSYLFKDAHPDSGKAAEALHHAIKNLQKQGVSSLVWAPFIHMGL